MVSVSRTALLGLLSPSYCSRRMLVGSPDLGKRVAVLEAELVQQAVAPVVFRGGISLCDAIFMHIFTV